MPGVACPKCKGSRSEVIDCRKMIDKVRRRRRCLACKLRWSTYEISELHFGAMFKGSHGVPVIVDAVAAYKEIVRIINNGK